MDPLRIAIISVLGREPMTVKQIAVELNRKPGTILHHLDRLKNPYRNCAEVLQSHSKRVPNRSSKSRFSEANT
ncbi:MAG: ArsR family transcriptional regulator [Candidatus Thorarchaeota archaeon]